MTQSRKAVSFFNRLQQSFAAHVDLASTIAIAVSGGADSMALALFAADQFGASNVLALSVDHGLRHGSAAEARWTKRQLEAREIDCRVLTVTPGTMPTGNLQAAARLARYQVMKETCSDAGVNVLCTAHTLDDQAETVFARLARGSGTKGLSGMKMRTSVPGCEGSQVEILRPALNVRKAELRAFLREKGQRWAEDPSNVNTRFDRIRLRKILSLWEASGFSAQRVADAAQNLQRSDDALEYYAAVAKQEVAVRHEDGTVTIDRSRFAGLPIDTQLRCLRDILASTSGINSAIRHVKLEELRRNIVSVAANRLTLHGCVIDIAPDQVIFRVEHARLA